MTNSSSLNTLNPEQRKAAETVQGRVLILAGAGCGKTLVLTMRMAHLVHSGIAKPEEILGLTFTNKAAAEMRRRMAKLLGEERSKKITLCTFHSFCLMVLRKDIQHLGYTKHFSLYDAHDIHRLITQISRTLLEHESVMPSLSPTINAISKARSQGVFDENSPVNDQWHDQFTKDVHKRLQDSLRAYNAVDFDNLLCLTVELFMKKPHILDEYQNRFRYLMIDEYQDTNPVQYQLAAHLSNKHNNLCVVGDDDQSIYGWRGAEVRNILEFDKACVIKLQQNYRSTNTILNAANAVIKNNKMRRDKELWSAIEGGESLEVFHAPTEIDEAQAVADRIVKLKESKNLSWKDIAILYRSNSLSRQIEMALLKKTWKNGDRWIQGVPYQIFGGEEYYERREVKDIMAYLRVILNPFDQEALLRIINLPRRGIGEETLDKLTSLNRQEGIPLWQVLQRQILNNTLELTDRSQKALEQFSNLMSEAKQKFENGNLRESVKWLIERVDFKRSIHEEVKSEKMRAFKWENVEEFVSAIGDYEDNLHKELRPQDISLHDFLTTTPLGQDKPFRQEKNIQEEKVTLMTFHSAKGLEFKACFLIGLEDHIIPHEKSLKETGIEEERRLMYVAITRAKRYLTLSMAKQRKRVGKDMPSRPSRFLFEIPKELLHISQWNCPP
ncbi:MAG: UvrD-helicase domain-containing protein [Parachlamydiales bacterium]|nr:UvrD-helicase domain-containing protein [Parachlamydiales bacterium]